MKTTITVVTNGCESWTIQEAEHWKIDAFELCCWRRLLRAFWTSRGSKWSILTEISPDYSLEGLMLKLKLQYFGHLIQRTHSLEKTLMLGKIKGRRRRGQQRIRWLDDRSTGKSWVWASSRNWWWTGKPGVLQSMESQRIVNEPWRELILQPLPKVSPEGVSKELRMWKQDPVFR